MLPRDRPAGSGEALLQVSLCSAHSEGLTVDMHLCAHSCSASAEALGWKQWQGFLKGQKFFGREE